MLSVPFSTSDFHSSCWQSGENCRVVAAGAFTLLGSTFWFSLRVAALFISVLFLPTRCLLDVSPLKGLTLRSIRSCLSLPPRFMDTREAGICAGSRVWSSSFSLFGSAPDDVCPVISCARTVLDHLFLVRLSALKKYYVLLHVVCRLRGSRFDELPQDCFVVFCVNMFFLFSHCTL